MPTIHTTESVERSIFEQETKPLIDKAYQKTASLSGRDWQLFLFVDAYQCVLSAAETELGSMLGWCHPRKPSRDSHLPCPVLRAWHLLQSPRQAAGRREPSMHIR